MSCADSERLTEEQEKLLKSLEEEFKDRYTENDEGYLATLKSPPPLPPVVEKWRDFRRRDKDRSSSYRNERERDRYSDDRGRRRYRDDQERDRYSDDRGRRRYRDDQERYRYRYGERYSDGEERRWYSDRYPHHSRNDYDYRNRNHHPNENRFD